VGSFNSVDLVPLSLVGVPLEDLEVCLSDVVAALENPDGAINTNSKVESADTVVVSFRSLNGSVGEYENWLF
jgi:hypothetical protein